MFRKVLGVILLVLAGWMLITVGMVCVMAVCRLAALPVLLIFLVPGVGLMLLGALAWGWARRRMVWGVLLTTVGGLLAMTAITIPLVMMSPMWDEMGGQRDLPHFPPMIAGQALSAVVFLLIGIPLILSQRKRDRLAAAASSVADAPEAPTP